MRSNLMLPRDRDFALIHAAPSGGQYVLHQLLLAGNHWCKFQLPDRILQQALLELSSQQQQNLKTTKEQFARVWQPGWPNYTQYFSQQQDLPQHCAEILQPLALQFPVNLEDFPGMWHKLLHWVIEYQWAITKPQHWKSTELLVLNNTPNHTQEYQFFEYLPQHLRRVYLFCNDFDSWVQRREFKILLYTDVDTQYKMAVYKNHPLQQLVCRYLQSPAVLQNHRVLPEVARYAIEADAVIYLQDFVNDPTPWLGAVNPAQLSLQQRWLDLHPPSLLQQVGIIR